MATSTPTGPGDAAHALELDLGRNAEAPSIARAAIVGFCQHRDVRSGTVATVMLLVSEIVTNAAIHPDAAPETRIKFSARMDPKYVVLR